MRFSFIHCYKNALACALKGCYWSSQLFRCTPALFYTSVQASSLCKSLRVSAMTTSNKNIVRMCDVFFIFLAHEDVLVYIGLKRTERFTPSPQHTLCTLVKMEIIMDDPLHVFLSQSKVQQSISKFWFKQRISWHFTPECAPHFGGLWEAAVKSFKHHLGHIMGDVKLTFEELTTILTQIKACLNSRPLTPLP